MGLSSPLPKVEADAQKHDHYRYQTAFRSKVAPEHQVALAHRLKTEERALAGVTTDILPKNGTLQKVPRAMRRGCQP